MAKLQGVQESTGSGFADIEPGAYKLVITKVEVVKQSKYVRIYWDVAEGPHKGNYEKSQYPPSDVLSWKETAQAMLKGKLHRIYLCNQQRLHQILDEDGKFLIIDEFENEDFNALVGCRFGAVVRRRLYTAGAGSKTPGADRTTVEIARYLSPDEFKNNDWSKKLLQDNDQRDNAGRAQEQRVEQVPSTFNPSATPDLYDEEIPF